MIKLLMIQPENHEINRFRRPQFNNFSQLTMPYLAAFVNMKYYEVTLVDEYCQRIPYDKLFDLAAITVTTPNAPHCYDISQKLRKAGVKVAMGGPHATLLPDEVEGYCDYLFIGEGEDTWPTFLEDFRKCAPERVYKADGPQSLISLPTARRELLKRHRIMKAAVFATRGCPYHCRYCNLKQIYYDSFRTRPIKNVITEVSGLRSKFFVFWDDNLFADKAYAKELLRNLIPLRKRWAAQATLRDCADGELLSLAKEAGCLYLFVGLESFSEKSLNHAGKDINRVTDFAGIINGIHRHGIMIQAGIVFGFDGDTPDVFDTALDACEKLGVDGATVSVLTPFPATPIYEQMRNENRLIYNDWSKYNSKTVVAFKPKNMSADELLRGYSRFRRRFYSLGSFIRRMRVSRTNVPLNFIINLGYRLSVTGGNNP